MNKNNIYLGNNNRVFTRKRRWDIFIHIQITILKISILGIVMVYKAVILWISSY